MADVAQYDGEGDERGDATVSISQGPFLALNTFCIRHVHTSRISIQPRMYMAPAKVVPK